MAKYLDYDGMLYFWSKLKEKFASIGSAFTPKGSASTIPSITTATIGDVYNMSAEFTTTTDFVEGDGITYPVGTNIICVNSSGTKKWDVLSGFVNLSGYSKTDHNHDSVYSKLGHTHSDYATYTYLGENYYTNKQIDDGFAKASHNHDSKYAPISHNHDDRYYTETEIDTKMSGKSDTTHNHDSVYSKLGHTHSASEIQGATGTESSEGTPYVLGSTGSGAEASWVDLNSYYSLKTHTHSNATTSASGFMSSSDKTKLNGIATGATADSAITNSEIDTILAS